MFARTMALLQLVRFEHSVFALPFAVATALYASRGEVLWGPFGWILLAMVSARTAAMGFNRIADRRFDALNPRTRDRHIPSGTVSIELAWGLVAVSSGLFVLSSGMLNRTCLIASGPLLAFLFGYSLSKRFTWFSHLYLGTSLGLAPVGVWMGLAESLDAFPLLLGAAIALWVTGFDIIYACLDEKFDRQQGLYSIPARFGVRAALALSTIFHSLAAAALVALGIVFESGWIYWTVLIPTLVLLGYEHWIVRPGDLKRVNVAFFGLNAAFSVALMVALVADLLA
jgi:4-hydroxybenzoate polyprenyltransferase